MPNYQVWTDPRAASKRHELRSLAPKDLASGTLRLAMHLSDLEEFWLSSMNPDTLGLPPGKDRDAEWAKFIAHPESSIYRVNKV